MSTHSRQLDGFAFTLALEAMGRDRLPYPLSYLPPPMEHEDDYQRYRQQRARGLRDVFDEDLYNALTVLLEPEVRVEIYGMQDHDRTAITRIHAGITGNRATIAVQHPGPTPEHGGEVLLTRHPARQAAAHMVAQLPSVTPGARQPLRARRSDLDAPVYSRHPTRLSPQEEMQRFFRRRRTGTGEITVYPGYTVDARPTDDGSAFLWLDYPQDGRYLLRHYDDENFATIPGSPEETARQIQIRIDALAQRTAPARY